VDPVSCIKIPGAGSARKYFRMSSDQQLCVGVHSPDPRESRAFITFTKHFLDRSLNVPELLAEDIEKNVYLLEDLGDTSLKDVIDRARKGEEFPSSVIPLYRSALDNLLDFQIKGHEGLDYSVCVPRQEFDRQSIMWDLNHFKYYFIKLLNIPFDEQKLEDDFNTLADGLLMARRDFFMFRDFQSRNIMVKGNDLYFIDYQGGRRGALQYDLASILFEAKTCLPADLRQELLEHYLKKLRMISPEAADEFMNHYYLFVLIRILQAMGAYGIRGIIENKALFLQSIPYAIQNLRWLLDNTLIPVDLIELKACLESICDLEEWRDIQESGYSKLRITINSFSYRKSLPRDHSGNGGGHVFDCRALPNPGRYEEYKQLTGRDTKVIDYLRDKKEVAQFLDSVKTIVSQSIESYQSMDYTSLMVSFGCTGGQHRSVYCAEKLNEFLNEQFQLETVLVHKELNT
jgi:aminoglycoside/choline kinase family phosphotransferase